VAYLFDNPLRGRVHPPQELLAPYVREGMRVLDVGCGLGHFTLGMARMVGDAGRVTAVDVQARMLQLMLRRARRAGLAARIEAVQCAPRELGVPGPFDFALASNMLHESPDPERLLGLIRAALRPGGRLLAMEPSGHVDAARFEAELDMARRAGFALEGRPDIRRERSAVLLRPAEDAEGKQA
jgi:ubiquinone/menaquinone biosynthesis C-methylase UbiE